MSGASAAGVRQEGTLEEMRQRWWPQWCVWRSRNSGGELNEWCATRRGEGRECSMTLMLPTADALEEALVRQADRSLIHG